MTPANDEKNMNAKDLLLSLRSRAAPLPYDFGAFIALETCEAVSSSPRLVELSDIEIGNDGAIAVNDGEAVSSADAARYVARVLSELLSQSGPGVPPMLEQLAKNGPSAWTLETLRDELSICLVPLNRGASRRVLARMLREANRDPNARSESARPPGPASEPPTYRGKVDPASLSANPNVATEVATKSEVRIPAVETAAIPAPAKAPERASRKSAGSTSSSGRIAAVKVAEVAMERVDAVKAAARVAEKSAPGAAEWDDTALPVTRDIPLREVLAAHQVVLDQNAREAVAATPPAATTVVRDPSFSRPLVASLTVLLAVVGAFVAGQRFSTPDVAAVAPVTANIPAVPPVVVAAPPAAPISRGTITLTMEGGAPAQVLRYVGRGPLTLSEIPKGARSEFVAIVDGHAPTRVSIAADATWEDSKDGPLMELAMQIPEVSVPAGTPLNLGTSEISAVNAPAAATGVVRIVTTPRGAKIYRVLGNAASLGVANWAINEPAEFLVQRENGHVEKVLVGPSDWTKENGVNVANISVTLTP